MILGGLCLLILFANNQVSFQLLPMDVLATVVKSSLGRTILTSPYNPPVGLSITKGSQVRNLSRNLKAGTHSVITEEQYCLLDYSSWLSQPVFLCTRSTYLEVVPFTVVGGPHFNHQSRKYSTGYSQVCLMEAFVQLRFLLPK